MAGTADEGLKIGAITMYNKLAINRVRGSIVADIFSEVVSTGSIGVTPMNGHDVEEDPMNRRRELQELMCKTATPAAELDLFQAKLNDLRTEYPGKWIVYRDDWDRAGNKLVFEVLGVYATQKAAVDMTWELDDDARAKVTLFYAEIIPPRTYRVNGNLVAVKN
jgi:hypothetical protein